MRFKRPTPEPSPATEQKPYYGEPITQRLYRVWYYRHCKQRMASAVQRSRPCFTDDAARRIVASYSLYGSQGVVYNILECEHLRKKSPTSLADFAAKTDRVFSPAFLHHIQQKCDAFDDMCGAPVADAFFGQKTYMEWAQLIAENCIRKHVDLPPNPTDWGRPGVGQAAPPITQIHLKGASIKDAWNDSPEALKISPSEQMSSHQQWTPADLGVTGAHVFHGTPLAPSQFISHVRMVPINSFPSALTTGVSSRPSLP
ncbi:hypothetical protein B0T11DRAFT_102988 [Plectosphaerella cucumerina]|uniref:Uncharacterized protein n=1 Tax=Plectosphaerella cucumerina TaxID=40658 RepID=A0A8K0X169_9PEZI|nr:hypothetical protein B0T11DRAFT_102988 [Plectosphaerella cucumerina]